MVGGGRWAVGGDSDGGGGSGHVHGHEYGSEEGRRHLAVRPQTCLIFARLFAGKN